MEHFSALFRDIRNEALVLRLWQSGRELFHSNVLAYLLESSTFGPRLLKYFWGASCDGFHVRALREENGIDLLVIMLPVSPDRGLLPEQESYWAWLAESIQATTLARVLVIENKFKSLPDAAQLQGYSRKLHSDTLPFARKLRWYAEKVWIGDDVQENDKGDGNKKALQPYLVAETRKVILTPTSGSDVSVELPFTYTVASGMWQRKGVPVNAARMQMDLWKSCNWQEVAGEIAGSQASGVADSDQQDSGGPGGIARSLERSFIDSYGKLLAVATELQQELNSHCQGGAAFSGLDSLTRQAQTLRLNDFVQKWRYEFLTSLLRTTLADKGWIQDQPVLNKRGSEMQFRIPTGPGFVAVVGTFFSRGTGGTDIGIFCRGDSEFAVEVQLQGNTLKLMFAFDRTSSDEERQRRAVLAALSALHRRDGATARNLGAPPADADKLLSYTQTVRIRVETPAKQPAAVELKEIEGRLLYTKTTVWKQERGGSVGPWAAISAAQIGEQIAAVAAEVVDCWHLIAEELRGELKRPKTHA